MLTYAISPSGAAGLRHLTALAALTALTLPSAVARAQSGLPAWIEPPEGSVRFGQSVASGADVNGDGVNDIFIADPGYTNEVGMVGRWFVYSGATHEIVWSVVGTDVAGQSQSRYRFPAAFIDDLDGDEVADLLVGRIDVLDRRGVVEVYSGRTGGRLLRIVGELPGQSVGIDVTRLGDIDGDLVDDFAYIESNVVNLCSGATGEVFESIVVPFARRIRNSGDVDADGVADFAVGVWTSSALRELRMYSGRKRDLIWTADEPSPNEDVFGYNLAAGHDLDGDAIPDVLVTGREGYITSPRCWVASGATGSLSLVEVRSESGGSPSASWVALGDLNGDGLVEPLIGFTLGQGAIRRVNVYSHKPGPEPIDQLAYTVDWPEIAGVVYGTEMAVADVNGDGAMDLLLGSANNAAVHIIGGSPMLFGHDYGTYAAFGEREVRRGFTHRFAAVGNAVGRPVRLAVSRRGNGCTFIPQLGICLDLDRPFQQIAQAITDADGFARFSIPIPANTSLGPVWMQCLDVNFPRRGPSTSNVMKIEIVE
ncbi:MAG: integrin alpha [Phycisphaerales bacterium]|nr:integrin alpha [Phycisphaerales bacterium]